MRGIDEFITKFAVFLIRAYRKYISPCLPRSCRFYPTCSAYALEAIASLGFFKGGALSAWRVLRCNPFCAGGYDPAPENKRERRAIP